MHIGLKLILLFYFAPVRLFKKRDDIQRFVDTQRSAGILVSFVPTMGALHQGHLDLVREAAQQNGVVIVSIFVNPTQFNDKSDLDKYPRNLEKDIELLAGERCDAIFYPDASEVYPVGVKSGPVYQLGRLEQVFEGAYRPGHFQGVCQVLDRLFHIIRPDHVFFGQKDYQQCLVVRRLIQTTPAFQQIRMHIAPTRREPDGLAMSSRNLRLSKKDREKAPVLFAALSTLRQAFEQGEDLQQRLNVLRFMLSSKHIEIDYLDVVSAENLEEPAHWDGSTPLIAIVAAWIGGVRLIDNLILTD
jgi:pantoate--beta-alanine ligase